MFRAIARFRPKSDGWRFGPPSGTAAASIIFKLRKHRKFDIIGGGKQNRVYPVFRDRDELSAGHLGDQIEANLKASAALSLCARPDFVAFLRVLASNFSSTARRKLSGHAGWIW